VAGSTVQFAPVSDVTAYVMAPSPDVAAALGVTVAAGIVTVVVGDQLIVGTPSAMVTVTDCVLRAKSAVEAAVAVTEHAPAPV
jgi:hypothetical protein